MGFWSTILVALRFKTGQIPVVTSPLHTYRIQQNTFSKRRFNVDSITVQKINNDVEVVHRVQLEAR